MLWLCAVWVESFFHFFRATLVTRVFSGVYLVFRAHIAFWGVWSCNLLNMCCYFGLWLRWGRADAGCVLCSGLGCEFGIIRVLHTVGAGESRSILTGV